MEQFSTFIAVALLAFVAFCYYEKFVAQKQYYARSSRRGNIKMRGRDIEMFVCEESTTGWGNA